MREANLRAAFRSIILASWFAAALSEPKSRGMKNRELVDGISMKSEELVFSSHFQ
jgi:hypothetical protein